MRQSRRISTNSFPRRRRLRLPPLRLRKNLLRLLRNKLLTGLCISLSLATLVPLLSIVFLVVRNGLPLISPALFTQLPPPPGLEDGGFANAIIGTLIMVGIALVLAVPLGVLAAIYINEYAPTSTLSSVVFPPSFAVSLLLRPS